MDDDDYYPPERVSHAVDKLMNSKALCAGSSAMFIYFKHLNKMCQFGPYGPNHATAATFAFKRELLKQCRFNEEACLAEERQFLKEYTIPFVQLESTKTILVFSHNHNSFDKKELLKQMPSPFIHETPLNPNDIIKETDILNFFMNDVDELLENYEVGKPKYKPDVSKQIAEINIKRANEQREKMEKQMEYQNTISKLNMMMNPDNTLSKLNEQTMIINNLMTENKKLMEQNEYLNNKIKLLILSQIEKNKESK
jgi:hypothetical protein